MRSASMSILPLLVLLGSACAVSAQDGPEHTRNESNAIDNGTAESDATAVALGMVRLTSPGIGTCSGTLIDDVWVLTAAHCTIDFTQLRFDLGPQSSTTRYVVHHPSLDAALVRLDTPLRGGKPRLADVVRPGQTVKCYGYGRDSFRGTTGSLSSAWLTVDSTSPTEITFRLNASGQLQNKGDSGGTCLDSAGAAIGVDFERPTTDVVHLVPMPAIAAWVRSHTSKEAIIPWRHFASDAAGNYGATGYWRFDPGGAVARNVLQSSVPAEWVQSGFADFDGNGHRDFLWRNKATQKLRFWLTDGAFILRKVEIADSIGPDFEIGGTGDFDGDGLADIAFRNDSADVRLLYSPATTPVQSGTIAVGNGDWKISGTGDFDGDGRTDLLWYNAPSALMGIWYMGSAQPFLGPLLGYVSVAAPTVGDFDGDGHDDIFWRNYSDGTNVMWLMGDRYNQTVKSALSAETVADTKWMAVAAPDVDADGRHDLFWRYIDSTSTAEQPVGYWRMNGADRVGDPVLLGNVDLTWGVIGN